MKILVLPGLGDIHWVMLKMESFIEQHCPGEKPEIWIWDFDGRRRGAEFVKRISFVKFGGYWEAPIRAGRGLFERAYMVNQDQLTQGFHHFDYFFCVNGGLRVGDNFETQILPEYKVNWNYQIDLDDIEPCPWENYVMFCFSDFGMFSKWVQQLPEAEIQKTLKNIQERGYEIVLTGSEWDKAFTKKIEINKAINLCGETSLDDLFALMKGAKAFVGWCGGNTMIAPHIGTKTLMLWSNYFKHQGFWTNWIRPDLINKTYFPADVSIGSENILRKFDELIR